MSEVALVFPHQLFESHPAIRSGLAVYLVEDPLFFVQYPFHRQKLMLHRASMKRYEAELKKRKCIVEYVEAHQLSRTGDIVAIASKAGSRKIHLVDPEDNYLARRLKVACLKHSVEMNVIADPNFLTSAQDIASFVGQKKKLFFTQFYIEQRTRMSCMLESDGKPLGGKWSFDTENRRKLPKNVSVPTIALPHQDKFTKESKSYVEKNFPHAIGEPSDLLFPSSREDARSWLAKFLDERLAWFGDYEDAIVRDENFLFHSGLTPMLNIGLLSPQEVIDMALERTDHVPINSIEGFVRQVIGWREFIRMVYRERGGQQRTRNFWEHKRKISASFYNGTTGIDPIDVVIRRVLKTGYCHHIERLMVLGNFMLLCEFHPNEVYRWFMEMFIDAYDWVMVPNVYGMSQHADGGLMTTKPYISGSSYVLRMSDFKRGPWCEVWDALYWNFLAKHRPFFERNPRMSVMTRQLDRMGEKLARHQSTAKKFLEKL